MDFPLKTEILEAYLPHRPPMRWIDEVLSVGETEGVCGLTLRTPALYWCDGRILPTAPLEWMSQAYGFYRAAFYASQGVQGTVERAFLAGIRDAVLEDLSGLKVGQTVRIHVSTTKTLGPLTLVQAHAEVEGVRIAVATLKLYAA